MSTVVIGCGDIGRRIARIHLNSGHLASELLGLVRTVASQSICVDDEIPSQLFDLDSGDVDTVLIDQSDCYYTVAPQKHGEQDLRSLNLIRLLELKGHTPNKVVLLSTTGVYGNTSGAWVEESDSTQPQTDRGQRRLNSEAQWRAFGERCFIPIIILRVPGIYAYSRLPRARVALRTPVVAPQECGFTNRIHADDLAQAAVQAMRLVDQTTVFNISDGTPGKISEYLQAVAKVLGEAPLAEISMAEAQQQLSEGMLSYLTESRKISNKKMLDELKVDLLYPNFLDGIRRG